MKSALCWLIIGGMTAISGMAPNIAVGPRTPENPLRILDGQAWNESHFSAPIAPVQPRPPVQSIGSQRDDRISVLVHLDPRLDRGHAPGAAVASCRTTLRGFAELCGARIEHEYDILPHVINLRGLPRKEIAALENQPGVLKVVEDKIFQISLHDSIPLVRGLPSQLAAAGLSADAEGVRVCILDTGIDSDHTMFTGQIDTAAGYDFVNNDAFPEDDNRHGSHVAGIIGGRTGINVNFGCSGSEPFQGMAPQASLIAVKVCNSSGSCLTSNIVAGINRCASPTLPGGPADVINMSLGGGQFAEACDTEETSQAANNAVAAGVVVVAAAGNNAFSSALNSPACGSQVIAVGATYDQNFPNCEAPSQRTFNFCTNRGLFGQCAQSCTDASPRVDQRACFSNRGSQLDVTAPGCVVYSADTEPGGVSIVGLCGTSMASPHVAGLAALILGLDPALTPAEVRQIIREGAVDLGAPGFDPSFGYGRIDVINSLQLVAPRCDDDADCDDATYCNGPETCIDGLCHPGELPCSGQACRETDQACVTCLIHADCDDGVFCNGAETCSASGDCVPAAELNCEDSLVCTTDSCNEETNQCDHLPNHAYCNDGYFCNGIETCSTVGGCVSPPPPCGSGECDELIDACVRAPAAWMSFADSVAIPGVGTVENEDIVAYDLVSGTWSLIFDGSDVGLSGFAIDGLAITSSGEILLSFVVSGTLPGMIGGPAGGTELDDSDLVRFVPASLGAATSGSFYFYFDGSDVGLTQDYEDVDAISLTGDGRLLLSTIGSVSVPGAVGTDADLLIFTPTSLGATTTGTFQFYFDGSDVGYADYGIEDLDAISWSSTGALLVSTLGNVSVPGVNASNEDILRFAPTSLGSTTAGVHSLFLDLSGLGIDPTEDVTGVELVE